MLLLPVKLWDKTTPLFAGCDIRPNKYAVCHG